MEDVNLTSTLAEKSGKCSGQVQWFLLTSAQYLGLIEAGERIQFESQYRDAAPMPGTGPAYTVQHAHQPESVL